MVILSNSILKPLGTSISTSYAYLNKKGNKPLIIYLYESSCKTNLNLYIKITDFFNLFSLHVALSLLNAVSVISGEMYTVN